MRTALLGALCCVLLFVGCGQKAEWNRAPRILTYLVEERAPATAKQHNWQLKLEFNPTGVTATEWGVAFPATIDVSGRLTSVNHRSPPILYEMAAVAVLPPSGRVRQGDKWTALRPNNAESLASDAIVGQEKFDYEVLSVDNITVRIKVSGTARIAPSAGLQRLLGTTSTPLLSTAGSGYVPYVSGSAEFNRQSGSVQRAEGIRLPLSVVQSGPTLDSHPLRVEYKITQQ